ncbi:MAG: hypothetical protein KAI47_09895, partial [Deltaproteobacteria bacterium]|nr:hypothetical protein [Deltaproteobacteria bacterium]
MKHLTRARPSAVLTTVLIALTLPSTLASFEHGAQANPINCCDLQPSAPVGQTAATLKLTLHKWCIKDDPCPDPSKIQISRDGTPIARTWVLEDNATSCEYTAQETRIAIHHDYK